MQCYNDHILNEKKVNLLKKVFFNYFDKKFQEAKLKLSMEIQIVYFSFKMIKF